MVSRLSVEIREKRGLAYSVYSYFLPMRELGPYLIGLQTRNDQVSLAVAVVQDTVERFVAEGPTEAELEAAIGDEERSTAELGDVLFAAVNVARHLRIDPELAVRAATVRFEERFRWIEAHVGDGDMAAMSLRELDALWDRAKAAGIGES